MTSEVSPIQQANRDGAQRLQATEDGFTASTRFIARLRPHCPQMPLFHARQDSRAQAWTLPGGSQLQIGAVERTRTSTALRPTAPKADSALLPRLPANANSFPFLVLTQDSQQA